MNGYGANVLSVSEIFYLHKTLEAKQLTGDHQLDAAKQVKNMIRMHWRRIKAFWHGDNAAVKGPRLIEIRQNVSLSRFCN